MVQKMTLSSDADVVAAWKQALALSRRLGLSLFKQACLSGAVLELSRHALEHAGKATCELSDASDGASLRARVVVDGCAPDIIGGAPGKLSREINVGPALPAVKLHQVVETLEAAPGTAGARVTLTIQQSRASRPAGRHPVALAAAERRR